MKKILKRKIVWNNVQFIPPRSDVWYRFYSNDFRGCLSSVIKKGKKRVEVSFFTSDGNIRGWTAVIYNGYKLVAWRDLKEGNYIKDKRIGLVEDEALEWAEKSDET